MKPESVCSCRIGPAKRPGGLARSAHCSLPRHAASPPRFESAGLAGRHPVAPGRAERGAVWLPGRPLAPLCWREETSGPRTLAPGVPASVHTGSRPARERGGGPLLAGANGPCQGAVTATQRGRWSELGPGKTDSIGIASDRLAASEAPPSPPPTLTLSLSFLGSKWKLSRSLSLSLPFFLKVAAPIRSGRLR